MPPRDLPQFDNDWLEVAGELEEMAANIRTAVDAEERTYYALRMRPWQQTAIKAVYRGLIEDEIITGKEQ